MSIDDTITALKARAYDVGRSKLAEEIGVSDDTLRRIFSTTPPGWVEVVRKMQEAAAKQSPASS